MSIHAIQVDRNAAVVLVYRAEPDGALVLAYSYPFDELRSVGFDLFSKQLGEDIVFDTPELRELFAL